MKGIERKWTNENTRERKKIQREREKSNGKYRVVCRQLIVRGYGEEVGRIRK